MNEIFPDLDSGLALLGWTYDQRLTTDDGARLWTVAETALQLQNKGAFTDVERDSLALKAFEILYHQVIGPDERADMVSCTYYNSRHFRTLIPLIDEATICFFRGYCTASLSLLFVVLEAALLSIYGWTPGDRKPRFSALFGSVLTLPDTHTAQLVNTMLRSVYSNYEADSPSRFLYNRHGLLHGLRTETKYDEMNCARTLQLFDTMCCAEKVVRTALGECLDMFGHRSRIYEDSRKNRAEQMLMSIMFSEADV